MRKVLLLAISFITIGFSNSVAKYELKANEAIFKAGFEAGIKALEFQRKNDGYQPIKININKEFYIVYDITSLPYEEALFLQNIANRDGFDTHITKSFLFFGEFERKADALKAIDDLKQKFKIDAKLKQKNKDEEFLITYPKLWGNFFTIFMAQVAKDGYIIVKNTEFVPIDSKSNIDNKTKVVTNKASTKQPQAQIQGSNKPFTLKNSKAMSYKKVGSGNNSQNYKENGLISKEKFYLGNYNKAIVTEQGEKFYKVLDKNIYFSDKDVVIIKE